MNILFVSHYSDCYGANIALVNLILELLNYGVRAKVIIPEHGTIEEVLRKNDIDYEIHKFYKCKVSKNSFKLKNIIKIILNYILYSINEKKINAKEFDIIHSNSSCTDYGAYLADKKKLPHVWHYREFGYDDYNLVSLYNEKIVTKLYKKTTVRIAISNSIKEYYENKYYPLKFELIYDGVKNLNKVTNYCDSESDKVKFCVVGLINQKKNQIEILKACQVLKRQGINNYIVHILGGGNEEYLNRLKILVNHLGLNDNIFFNGYIKNASEVLRNYDVGIISSFKEGFGLVTIEYMFAGLPVIGNNTGATPELIIEGYNGILFESNNDGSDLAKCMRKYIENKNIIKEHGENGRKRALKYFSSETNTKNIYEVYLDICARNYNK